MNIDFLHELKTLRAELKCIKCLCKNNKARTQLTAQINHLTELIEELEREERANDVQALW